MKALLKHPLHLVAIVAGATAVFAVLWFVDPSGGHALSSAGGLIALLAAVDLARRLGLEPKDDPARPAARQEVK